MSILFPVFAMALITFLVTPLMLTTRINSVKNGIVTMKFSKEASHLPAYYKLPATGRICTRRPHYFTSLV